MVRRRLRSSRLLLLLLLLLLGLPHCVLPLALHPLHVVARMHLLHHQF